MKPEDFWFRHGGNPGLESDCSPAAYAAAWDGLDKVGPLGNGVLLNGERWRNMPLGMWGNFFNLKAWKEACQLLISYPVHQSIFSSCSACPLPSFKNTFLQHDILPFPKWQCLGSGYKQSGKQNIWKPAEFKCINVLRVTYLNICFLWQIFTFELAWCKSMKSQWF